jgi:transcriptional regulator with XRE-family HTH domain
MSSPYYSFLVNMQINMGFKENLKAELVYRGMLVKELAAKTGISKHTIDNYLNVNNCMPSAESAVKIARTLGVSVEYLVTGRDAPPPREAKQDENDVQSLVRLVTGLGAGNRAIIHHLATFLRSRE